MSDNIMNIKTNLLDKIGGDIPKTMKKSMDEEEIILFVSFDLVNSSRYKTRNYTSWFPILITINEKIKKHMKCKIPNSQLWRSIGDEVIFIINITNYDELKMSVQSIFEILNDITLEIKQGKILNEDSSEKNRINIFISQNVLSLKAGAWIAPVHKTSDLTKQTNNIHNLMYMYNQDNGLPTYEFQGNDIDTGFRLLENTRQRRLVISIELAYLLAKDQYIDPKINIITYRKLKGIWDDKLYPVIWYHDTEYVKCKIEDSFLYDEYYTDDLTKEFIDNKYNHITNSQNTSFQKLDKIIRDNNMMYKIHLLEDKFEKSDKPKKLIKGNKLLEVHCVAVCYNIKKHKVLMLKRNKDLSNYPDKWEFGCSTIGNGMTFEENLKKDYKKFADIDIDIKTPFKSYSFEDKDKKIIPGIRFLAEFDDERDSGQLKLDEKYIEAKYMDLEEYTEEKYKDISIDYEDFSEILKFVFEKYGRNPKHE